MNNHNNNNLVVTISRQYGSGGHRIGKKLAELLGFDFYDKELIALAAKESGFSEQLFEQAEKKATSSFRYSLSLIGTAGMYDMPLNDKLFLIQSDIINECADKGPCVIVGRCADYVLANRPNCINVFVYANMEDRLQRKIDEKMLSVEETTSLINKTDKCRANYYNYYTDQKWGNPENYHLCINSSLLGLEKTAEIIRDFVQTKMAEMAK